jgi:hypothetical protein
MDNIILALATEYRRQCKIAHGWRDYNGRLTGMGMDAVRKADKCLDMLRAYGYRFDSEDSLFFDHNLAESLDIPTVLWPEAADDQDD